MSKTDQKITVIVLAALAVLAPIMAWANSFSWQFQSVGLYELFPVFGLLAFSVFWTQLILLFAEPYLNFSVQPYIKWSGLAFILFVFLHPALLALGQLLNGVGVPPQSFYKYVPASFALFINIAIISWLIFMVTEVSFRLSNLRLFKSQKTKTAIEYFNYVAFYLIFWHSITLGQHLQLGWLKTVWWFFAVTATPVIIVLIARSLKNKTPQTSTL